MEIMNYAVVIVPQGFNCENLEELAQAIKVALNDERNKASLSTDRTIMHLIGSEELNKKKIDPETETYANIAKNLVKYFGDPILIGEVKFTSAFVSEYIASINDPKRNIVTFNIVEKIRNIEEDSVAHKIFRSHNLGFLITFCKYFYNVNKY